MGRVLRVIAATVCVVAANPAFSQEVVVTGQVRNNGYYAAEPNGGAASRSVINLKRTADFAVQTVRVIGDTRDAIKRREEIFSTVRNVIQLAAKSGVELSTGDLVLEPLTLTNYTNLPLRSAGRSDTDQALFLVKVRLAASVDTKAALDRIGKFVKAVQTVGRAEIETVGDLTLSVVDPNQYRQEIIELVAADAAATSAKFGAGYGVEVRGLDRPVEWARASLTEIFLYLPSTYVVRPKD